MDKPLLKWWREWRIDLIGWVVIVCSATIAYRCGFLFRCVSPDALSRADFLKVCDDNKGYAPATFLSLTVGLNVALAKWEPFRKSLTDVQTQLKGVMADEIKRSKLSAALVDESSNTWARLQHLVSDPVQDIDVANCRTWEIARRWSIVFAIAALIFIFGRCSGGLIGILFLLPTVGTWFSAQRSKSKVAKIVRSKIESIQEIEGADRAIADREYSEKIESALGVSPDTESKT